MGRTEPTLRKGGKVEITHAIDLHPYTTIEAGERGTVTKTFHDPMIGAAVEIALETKHPGLTQWDNKALLVRPESAYIKPLRTAWGKLQRFMLIGGASAALLGALKSPMATHMGWAVVNGALTGLYHLL